MAGVHSRASMAQVCGIVNHTLGAGTQLPLMERSPGRKAVSPAELWAGGDSGFPAKLATRRRPGSQKQSHVGSVTGIGCHRGCDGHAHPVLRASGGPMEDGGQKSLLELLFRCLQCPGWRGDLEGHSPLIPLHGWAGKALGFRVRYVWGSQAPATELHPSPSHICCVTQRCPSQPSLCPRPMASAGHGGGGAIAR